MKITKVRINPVARAASGGASDRLLARGSFTLDDAFVIHDVKVIESGRGPIVSMPIRKLSDACPSCRTPNHLLARYCNGCGSTLRECRASVDPDGRPKLFLDVAHPIDRALRAEVNEAVLEAYRRREAR